jgi:predicted outer membrane repeat protein
MAPNTQYLRLIPACALLLATAAPAALLPAAAQVIYVDGTATGANSGASWTDAYTDLQSALQVAVDGDQVWIAVGDYRPSATNDPADTFRVTKPISIYGGFQGIETRIEDRDPDGERTLLNGRMQSGNALHVVTVDHASSVPVLLDRLRIEWGNAGPASEGGGIRIERGPVLVSQSIFRFNEANGGGAIYSAPNASLEVIACRFMDNEALHDGGAIQFDGYGAGLRVAGTTFTRNYARYYGGAIHASQVERIEDTSFLLNTSGDGSGALYAAGQIVEGHVVQSEFIGNHATGRGGAAQVGNILFDDVNFESNTAYQAGAVEASDNVYYDECRFIENHASSGGAIIVQMGAGVRILRSVFRGNQATGGGGAIYCVGIRQSSGSLRVVESRFLSNTCGNSGGAILFEGWRIELANCLFDLNSAVRGGGAIYMPGDVSNRSSLVNLTFVRNSTGGHGGAIEIGNDFVYGRVLFANSIFWDNSDRIGTGEYSQLSALATRVNYCTIQGHSTRGGVGNTGQDPRFVNPALGDFHLRGVSPLIDAGDPNSRSLLRETRGLDLDGESRRSGLEVDIGADEVQ